MKKIILTLFMVSTLLACQNKGTDTGNPLDDNLGQEQPCKSEDSCLPSPVIGVGGTAGSICDTIKKCGGESDYVTCTNAVGTQKDLRTEIPLAYETIQEMDLAYGRSEIEINAPDFMTCMTGIQTLTCDSPAFLDAYNVQHPADYSSILKIFRVESACKTMYRVKSP